MEYNDSSNHDSENQSSKWYIELVDGNKFIVLFILSLGLYAIWWMYKSWRFFQQKEEPDMMPAARAIFGIFWAYSLFRRIQIYAKENGYTSTYNSGLLFVGYFCMNLSSRLPDPIGLVAIMAFAFLIPPVRALNFAIMNSDEYDGEEVDRYSAGQMAIVAFGIIFWGMNILGLISGQEMVN